MAFAPPARRQWTRLLLLPPLLLLVGTLGFHFLEGLSLFEALYLSTITLTTIGYGDVHPQTVVGRGFTMVFVLVGVFLLFYVATTIIAAVVSGEVKLAVGGRAMEERLASFRQHIIVCGYGRMGRLVCQEFAEQGLPFVVVEKQATLLENFPHATGVPLPGDATDDAVLKAAGVDRARGLIAVVSSDADNLYITMSARLLCEKLFIIARAEDEASEQKLRRAGASRSISPYRIGGARIAQALLRPSVVDFIELATRTSHLELQLEETTLRAGSPLVGKSVRDSELRRDLGLIIVAIKKPTGRMVFNPPAEIALEANDTLIALGERTKLDSLIDLAAAQELPPASLAGR